MSNVVRLNGRLSRRAQSSNGLSSSALGLTSVLGQMNLIQRASKEYLEEEIQLLARSSARTLQIIGQIKDDEIRARLSVHADRIQELVELASRRVAQL